MDETAAEMPRYKCHKEVHALKIERVETPGSSMNHRILHFADARFESKLMSAEFSRKHEPVAGGYYVVYEDGYESWSPGGVFEAGYSLIEQG